MKTICFLQKVKDCRDTIQSLGQLNAAVSDINGNLSTLEKLYNSDAVKFDEIATMNDRKSQNAIKWLLLALRYFSSCCLNLVIGDPNTNVKSCFEELYTTLLYPYHNVIQRNIFRVVLNQINYNKINKDTNMIPELREIQKFIKQVLRIYPDII